MEEGVHTTSGDAAYDGAVVWRSSEPKIAPVSQTGVVRPRKTGTVRITGRADEPDVSGRRAEVTAVRRPVEVEVNRVRAVVPDRLVVGQVAYVTGRYTPIGATGVKVTYRSSSTAVAEADVAGRILASGRAMAYPCEG